jgi:hypothetical protein
VRAGERRAGGGGGGGQYHVLKLCALKLLDGCRLYRSSDHSTPHTARAEVVPYLLCRWRVAWRAWSR